MASNTSTKQESKRHHYVPEFYLNQWAADCGKILTVRNIRNNIVRKWHAAKFTGFQFNLYSYHEDFDVEDRSEIETKYFKPLDDAGARIMSKIISKTPLERKDAILWAQFITSMVMRTPESIAKIKSKGKHAIITEMSSAQNEYSSLKDKSDPDTPIDWLQIDRPGLIENFGLMQIPKIGLNEYAMRNVLSFSWQTVEFNNSSKPILSSDRPCVVINGPQQGELRNCTSSIASSRILCLSAEFKRRAKAKSAGC